MPYTTPKDLLKKAQKEKYAVGAFNIENMEMAQAVIEIACQLHAPVILQTTPATLAYAPPQVFAGMIKPLANQANVPVALCLDHCSDYDIAMEALKSSYSGIMVDGSTFSFDENIALTKSVAMHAQKTNILVEGELGKSGDTEENLFAQNGSLTDPKQAKEFVDRTNINALAVNIGNVRGLYREAPNIDIQRLAEIKKRVSIPLVMHGASGIDSESISQCIANGICKINFSTELKIAYTDGVNAYMKKNPNAFDPKKYGTYGREFVKTLVKEKILMCGSNDKY